MTTKLRKRSEGFTIIEVLIVLAIAGLIMLIVFLAVPALQRNSRNNARRNDVARVGGEVNEFIANRNGTMPVEADMAGIMTNVGNLAGYATTDRVANATGVQAVIGATANQPRFRLVTGARCNTTNDGTTVAGSNRQAALQYQLETPNPGAHTNVCQEV